jgi:hypothetical protein
MDQTAFTNKKVNTFSCQKEGGSKMKQKQRFTQKQKLAVLAKARDIGVRQTADLIGVH